MTSCHFNLSFDLQIHNVIQISFLRHYTPQVGKELLNL